MNKGARALHVVGIEPFRLHANYILVTFALPQAKSPKVTKNQILPKVTYILMFSLLFKLDLFL